MQDRPFGRERGPHRIPSAGILLKARRASPVHPDRPGRKVSRAQPALRVALAPLGPLAPPAPLVLSPAAIVSCGRLAALRTAKWNAQRTKFSSQPGAAQPGTPRTF
jgi:hypothetical protein